MDKKLLVLLIFVILLLVAGGIIFAVTLNNNRANETKEPLVNQNTQTGSTANEVASNITGNNEETNEMENEEVGTNTTTDDEKVLVVYFSHSGNTETVANIIHEAVGGDIVKLETVKTYNSNYNDLLDEAQNEKNSNARPELKTKIENMDEYDTVILGYPNWWGDMPMPIYSFLDEYDLSGKTIAPFITHGGSGLSGTPNRIRQAEAQATVTEGLAVSGSSAGSSRSSVESWLGRIGIL